MLCNWERFPGNFLLDFMWKTTGSGPGYRVFHLAQMAIARDRKAVLRQFLEDVREHTPTTMVVCHGGDVAGPDLADQTIALLEAAL